MMVLSDQAPVRTGAIHTLGGPTMGTAWSARIAGAEASRLPELRTAIETELDRVVREMSTWDAGSDLSRYNRAVAGEWVALPEACRFVLARALAHAADSDGAFDPTVGPAVNRWGFGPERPRDTPPPDAHIAAHRARVDWRRVRLVGDRVLQPGGCYLDFSAIAKGYATDRVLAALAAAGIRHAMVEVGGELKAHGRRPDGRPWQVGVRWPGHADGEGPVVALDGLAIATSGDDFRYFESGGRRYSHTLDPRTGMPVAHALASVTVLHADAIEADAWATALLVLGPDAGVERARAHGLAALFVARDGTTGHLAHPTPAFLEALV